MSTYRAVMLTKKGGPETLQQVELPVKEPGPGELRIRVRACGVGYTDVTMRRAYYPYAPKMPFVPGYEVVGEVDAIGPGVTGFRQGQRVAALASEMSTWGSAPGPRSAAASSSRMASPPPSRTIDGKIVLVRES